LAARTLAETVIECEGRYDCVSQALKAHPAIKKDLTLDNEIILKKIENQKYVRVTN